MKVAKLSEERLKFLEEFCEEYDEAFDKFKESGEDPEDYEEFQKSLRSTKNITNAIRHLLTCYETLINNACDPAEECLEFRPDIKQFLDSKEKK